MLKDALACGRAMDETLSHVICGQLALTPEPLKQRLLLLYKLLHQSPISSLPPSPFPLLETEGLLCFKGSDKLRRCWR